MADRTAWRLCNQSGSMSAIVKTRKRRGKKTGPPVCDDLVERNFTAGGPKQLWLVDITEHRTREGKLCLWAVKDVFSRRIVGYSISDRMKARRAVDAVNNAVARRGHVTGCIVHSDRGSQFRSRKFLRALRYHGLVGSMGRLGAAGDNATMESYFALLQNNVLNRRVWVTREQLRSAIVVWIEKKYHRKRRQAALGSFDANRIRDHDGNTGRPGRVTKTVTKTCIRPKTQVAYFEKSETGLLSDER